MPEELEEPRIEEEVTERKGKILHVSEIPSKLIKNYHVEDMVIKRGLAADLPDGSTHVKAYFSTDSGVLSIWDGSAWLDTTLS